MNKIVLLTVPFDIFVLTIPLYEIIITILSFVNHKLYVFANIFVLLYNLIKILVHYVKFARDTGQQ